MAGYGRRTRRTLTAFATLTGWFAAAVRPAAKGWAVNRRIGFIMDMTGARLFARHNWEFVAVQRLDRWAHVQEDP